jgi:hypothetical protein
MTRPQSADGIQVNISSRTFADPPLRVDIECTSCSVEIDNTGASETCSARFELVDRSTISN